MTQYDLLLCTGGRSSKVYDYFQALKKNSRLKIGSITLLDTLRIPFPSAHLKPEKQLRWIAHRKAQKYATSIFFKLHKLSAYNEAVLVWSFYSAYFMKSPSSLIGLWNGHKFRSSIVVLAAKRHKKKVVYFENGLLPNTTTMDDKGINDANSLPRNVNFYLGRHGMGYKTPLPEKLTVRKSPYSTKVQYDSKIPLPREYLFVPFQVNTDSQITLHSKWIKDMHHFFRVLCNVLAQTSNTNLHFVLKEHPQCPQDYRDLHQAVRQYTRIMFANSSSVQELIEGSLGVVTINSTVGWESLLLGKKVISLGNACYNLPRLVQHVQDEKSLVTAINSLPSWQSDKKLRVSYLRYVHEHYCIPDTWHHPSKKHWHTIDMRLRKMLKNQPWLP